MIIISKTKSIKKLEMQFNVSVKSEEISLVLLKHFLKLKIELVIWKSRFGKSGLIFDWMIIFSLEKSNPILILMRS